MDNQLMREWRDRLAPKLRVIDGVVDCRLENKCLVVYVKAEKETTTTAVYDLFESQLADSLPMKIAVMPKLGQAKKKAILTV